MTDRVRPTSFAHARIPRAQNNLPSIIDDDMRRTRRCFRCAVEYVEWQNIGAWLCSEHMSPWDDDRKKYACCGSSSARGCVACDHAENPLTPYAGSVTTYAVTRGAPAFELCQGNLKELKNVYEDAIQRPPNESEQRSTVGDERVLIYIYRRSQYGDPTKEWRPP